MGVGHGARSQSVEEPVALTTYPRHLSEYSSEALETCSAARLLERFPKGAGPLSGPVDPGRDGDPSSIPGVREYADPHGPTRLERGRNPTAVSVEIAHIGGATPTQTHPLPRGHAAVSLGGTRKSRDHS